MFGFCGAVEGGLVGNVGGEGVMRGVRLCRTDLGLGLPNPSELMKI